MAKAPEGMVEMFGAGEVKEKPKAAKEEYKPMKGGYEFGEVASAVQKCIRNGDEENAVYWAIVLNDASPYYAWKRVVICAAEDVGLANPEGVALVMSLYAAWRGLKEKAFFVSPHLLTLAVMTLCRGGKSTAVEDCQGVALTELEDGKFREMPEYAIDCHTKRGKEERGLTGLPGDRKFYEDRHRLFGIPTNRYTAILAKYRPAWFEPIKDLIKKGAKSDV